MKEMSLEINKKETFYVSLYTLLPIIFAWIFYFYISMNVFILFPIIITIFGSFVFIRHVPITWNNKNEEMLR